MERETANKALLISENRNQLGQMRLLLERAGYEVLTAADGHAAFDLARRESPDIIISEVGTPPTDGIETCRRMRAHAELRATPILLVIDRRHREAVMAELTAEADDYIEAPFEALRLVTKVAQLIERRRTREALGASQSRLAGIVDSAMDAIITADDEQRIILFNAAAEKMFRCGAAEALGQPLDRFIPARFRAKHADHVRAFGQTGITTRAMAGSRAVYGMRADGEEFPIEASISQLESVGQKFYTVIMRDISERHRAEARFLQVIERAPNGMVMVDPEGKIVLVNTQIENLFGYGRDELFGQSIEMLVPKRFHAGHSTYRRSFLSAPMARPMGAGRDLYGLRKDGSEFPVEIGLNPLETEQGMMVLGTIVDITQRKRVEETLRRSQEQLVGIIGSAMDAIITADDEQRIILFNAAAEKMFRCGAAEALGQPLDRFIPARFRAKHADHVRAFGQTGITTRAMAGSRAVYGMRADGEEFPIEASISQLESVGQKFYTVIMRDISERHRTEQAMRASEARFSIAFNASPISSVIATLDAGRYVAVNDTFLSLTGYRREEVIGRTSADLGIWPTPEARAEVVGWLEREGRIRNRETRYQMKNGELRTFLTSAEIIELDGQPHMITASIDITERKRAEEALREQAQILDLAPVFIRELTGRLLFWNRGAEQMYGWTPQEAIGQVSHDLLHTEFPQPLEEIQAAVFAQGHWEGELIHSRRDGGRIAIASHWVLHKDAYGEPTAILEVNNDITERKQIEKEVRRLNEELEQRVAERTAQLRAANRELEAFSYSVSHDLRAPLRHINGFSQALLEDYADRLDEEGKGYLQEVRDASREMAQLIDDLLQLARVTRSEMRREAVNLSEVVRAAVAELQKVDARRKVSVQIADGLLTHGDKRLLQVMLGNLLGNAWKFTAKRQQAEIIFDQTRQDGELVYFVRDNGAGFDMAYVNKLFGAFQRLHSGKEFEGTGIGLATVQRIVRRHGGRVWAEGQVNEGATFYFTLADFRERNHGEESDLTGRG
jgi:PAS domain S-box-containing protein